MASQRIEAWWRAHGERFVTRDQPSHLAGHAFDDAVRAALPDYLQPRFALPPDLAALVALIDHRSWQTDDEWHELWGTDTIVSNLVSDVRVHDDRELVESAGPWVQFARTGDHHHFFICCDASSAHMGHVLEGDDDHPWLENGLLRRLGREPLDLSDALPLADWLEQWRAVRADDDRE